MKRYILLVLLSVCITVGMQAQSSMTDNQVLEYIIKEQQRGTTQAQIVTKLMQRGVNISQIRRVRNMAERMQQGTGLGTVSNKEATDIRTRKYNGQQKDGEDIAMETRRISNDEMDEASKYSSYRMMREKNNSYSSYDAYDDEFLAMQDEMNDWMPADTAALYRKLLKETEYDKKHRKVFGRDIFNKRNLSFEPNMNIATPQNYVLGPGDAVYIDIYGASQKSLSSTVSPDGYINIDGHGPVQVSGLTVAQANSRLKSQLGSRYSNSNIRLSVGQTRTITVNVMGEVKQPGTYTLSAFASVFHALYMAGGPNELGTLRNIKVYRNNHLVTTVDVYDYMLNGKLTGNVKLADNDVILVSTYDCLVSVTGKVKRPMYYEMKSNESLGTLLRYAGGFKGDAYTKGVRVLRKSGRELSIYNVNEFDLSSFTIADEDSVIVDSVLTRYENMVEIKGAVFRPGMYQVGDDINSVRSLVEAADGITEFAFTNRAVMHRMRKNRTLEVISVDLKGILDGTVADIPLQNEDVLFIPSLEESHEEKTLTIHGEVRYPGQYKYAVNETLEDFVLQAGGLTDQASLVNVLVSRRTGNPYATSPDSLIARTYSFTLKEGFVVDGQPGFTLEPYDEVYVRKSPGYGKQQNVRIDGEVMFAGTYTLTKPTSRLSDLVKAAGGPNNMAYIKGARLERKTNESERKRMEDALKMAREQEQKNMMELAARSQNAAGISQLMEKNKSAALERFNIPDTYQVGIELDKAIAKPGGNEDIILREGDRLIVPQYNGTVKINGAVMYANTVSYIKGKDVKYYIEQAGGFARDARRSSTYILYMNGMVAKVGHNAKVMPGCEIIVPAKAQNKMSIAERLAVGTGVTSIATMIATMANILK